MTDPAASSRLYPVTLVAGLAGATATAVGVAQPWIHATAERAGLPTVTVSVDGADIAPVAAALSFVLLASFGAVVATRGWVRRALGVLIVLAALVVVGSVFAAGSATGTVEADLSAHGWAGGDYETSFGVWRWLVVAGSVICAGAGALVARRGGDWATMGARYDAPGAEPARRPAHDSWSEADVWKAIDSGNDPTQSS